MKGAGQSIQKRSQASGKSTLSDIFIRPITLSKKEKPWDITQAQFRWVGTVN